MKILRLNANKSPVVLDVVVGDVEMVVDAVDVDWVAVMVNVVVVEIIVAVNVVVVESVTLLGTHLPEMQWPSEQSRPSG